MYKVLYLRIVCKKTRRKLLNLYIILLAIYSRMYSKAYKFYNEIYSGDNYSSNSLIVCSP